MCAYRASTNHIIFVCTQVVSTVNARVVHALIQTCSNDVLMCSFCTNLSCTYIGRI